LFQNLNVRFDTVRFELAFDIPNWLTLAIELGIGIPIAIVIFRLQSKSSDKIEDMTKTIADLTKQRVTTEQLKKGFECRRIIDTLEGIQIVEWDLKTFFTGYKLGDPTDEKLRLFYGIAFHATANQSIEIMKDAIGQLQDRLNDNSLRKVFSDYLGWFNVLPERILMQNMPQQEHQRDYLLHFIDDQMIKIKNLSTDSVKK
jgi:hypothetical protein